MKITKKVEDALNKQVNAEFYAAYLYLSMSAHLTSKGLSGMANWYHVQAKEEVEHAMKIYNYINERLGTVVLQPIEAVPTTFDSIMTIFKASLEHEEKVTKMIYNLVDIAAGEKDLATQEFLNWFVKEQVEEEDNANTLIDKLTLILGGKDEKSSGSAIYMLDKELGYRKDD